VNSRVVVGFAAVILGAHLGARSATAQQGVASATSPITMAEHDAILARRVTVDVERVSVRRAIDAIAASARIRIQYEANALSAYAGPVTLHAADISLGAALERVLSGTRLRVVVLPGLRVTVAAADDAESVVMNGGVSGHVLNATTKQPIVGATVMLDDSTHVVRTNTDGTYRFLNIAAGPHRLLVRSVGFARQSRMITVSDDQTTTVDIVLESSVNTLDQVVVTATGEQRIRELGHVVAQINADSLVQNAPISSVIDLLQSRVPGLQVLTGSGGVAGGNATLRLRGQSTVNLDPEPIVIVDGVRFATKNLVGGSGGSLGYDNRGPGQERNWLYDINPNDIETVEVVKGPSASTLYGPDAANGVIVITTKRPTAGNTEFKWYARPMANEEPTTRAARGYQAWGHDPNTGELVASNCTLVYQYAYHVCVLDSITVAPTVLQDPLYSMVSTTSPGWQYGASVSGGVQAVRYFLSGNYDSQTGAMHLGPALAQYLKDQLGIGTLSDAIRNPNTLRDIGGHATLSADVGSRGSIGVTAGYMQTDHRRSDMFGAINQVQTFTPGRDTSRVGDWFSARSFLGTTTESASRVDGSINATYRPLTWLTGTAVFGLDLAPSILHSGLPAATTDPYDLGYAVDSRRSVVARTMNLGLTAATHPGLLSFRTSVGLQYIYQHMDGLDVTADNLAPGSILVSTAGHQSVYQLWSETASLGTYVEEVLGVRDRLFLTGSLRIDGSTSYGDDYHPTPFPKVGVSWILSDEPLFRDIPGLSELRLRSSYGASSRHPTSGMKLGQQYGGAVYVDGSTQTVFLRSQLGNPALRPERGRETEYGMDATLFSRVNVGLTWYDQRTRDQLLYVQNGAGLYPTYENIGLISGHGFEATATVTAVNVPNARADITVAYSHHTDKLLDAGSARQYKSSYGSLVVGYPMGAAFATTITGVADTVGGVADHIVFPEEIIRDTVLRYRGVMYPPRTLTVAPTLALFGGRLRLSTAFDRQTDFVVKGNYQGCASAGTCLAAFDKDAPLLAQAMTITNNDDDFLAPGDFTRWREATVSVDVPQRFLRLDPIHLRFSQASINVQGRNLRLWTHFNGIDPESRTDNLFRDSMANGLAQTRVWSFRVDVTP